MLVVLEEGRGKRKKMQGCVIQMKENFDTRDWYMKEWIE